MVRIPMYWRAFVLRTTEYRMFLVASKKKSETAFQGPFDKRKKGQKDKRTNGKKDRLTERPKDKKRRGHKKTNTGL